MSSSGSSGWKGTLMGVAMAVVDAMVTGFGCQVNDIVVAVGPSVGACCFTLERWQALDFIRVHPDCVPDPESAKPHVNIRLANRYSSDLMLLVNQPGQEALPARSRQAFGFGAPLVLLRG